jgi:uncharacterized protein with HEPN domain
MPNRFGDKIRLQHALDAMDEIKSFTKGVGYEYLVQSQV